MKFNKIFLCYIFLFFSCREKNFSLLTVSIFFPAKWEIAHKQFEEAGYCMQYELSFPFLFGKRKVIENLCVEDFPIEVQLDARGGRAVLLYPPFDLQPAGAVVPWDLQCNHENKQELVLLLDGQKGWLASILGVAESNVDLAHFNYPRAKELVLKILNEKELASPFFLDENRVLRDFIGLKFSSFSIRSKGCRRWDLPSQFSLGDGTWYIGSLGISLTDQFFIDGFINLPNGNTFLFNPKLGVGWVVYCNHTKHPPLVVDRCLKK